ncbi:hypothetical protein [Marinicellulosiphila megalodicopiae]|uniref:hypothetical protein n=1 Tax=Marinicellulosiphila megalodicopiae TaxID=2724896 RepID=UPI003BB091DF
MNLDTSNVILNTDVVKIPASENMSWTESEVVEIVNAAVPKLGMHFTEATDFKNLSVSTVSEGQNTKVAYIESEEAYFIVSYGMLTNVSVTAHRWD